MFDPTHVLMLGAGFVLALVAIRVLPALRGKSATQKPLVKVVPPGPVKAVEPAPFPDPRVDIYLSAMRPNVVAALKAADEKAAAAVHADVLAQLATIAPPKP